MIAFFILGGLNSLNVLLVPLTWRRSLISKGHLILGAVSFSLIAIFYIWAGFRNLARLRIENHIDRIA